MIQPYNTYSCKYNSWIILTIDLLDYGIRTATSKRDVSPSKTKTMCS